MIVLDGTTGITTPAETVSGAITASTVTATGLISGSTNYTGFKNRIINGGMVIDQRNAGASVTPVGGVYTLDRWSCNQTTAGKFSVQRQTSVVPTGFGFALKATSLSAYSVGANDYFNIYQPIEGFNFSDMAWGTADAKTVTLSFQVYSSLTGTFGGSLCNTNITRSYPFSYSIPVANTWTTISVTIAGDTTGTWVGATNGVGVYVIIGIGSGTTTSGTANTWATGYYTSVTGATSVVGTSGATFYITGVQLEKGSLATSFDYRPYGTELQLCQRYLPAFLGDTAGFQPIANGGAYGAVNTIFTINFPVQARTRPTGISASAVSNYSVMNGAATAGVVTGITLNATPTVLAAQILVTNGAAAPTQTLGQYAQFGSNAGASSILLFTGCEL